MADEIRRRSTSNRRKRPQIEDSARGVVPYEDDDDYVDSTAVILDDDEEAERRRRRARARRNAARNGLPDNRRRRRRRGRRADTRGRGRRRGKKRRKKRKTIGSVIFSFFQLIILAAVIFAAIFMYQKFGKTVLELRAEAIAKVEASDESVFYQNQTTEIYDDAGNVLTTLKGDKDVYYLYYDQIPDYVKEAFISIEDKRFYEHKGYDLKAITRAFFSLLKNKAVTQGGSTITQQLSRNIFLSHTVKWERKVEEIFISIELEKKYTKDQILEFYINNIYFANGYYGIEAASRGYFGKHSDELSLSQIAFLCAIPNSPTRYDPRVSPDNTLERRDRILDEMLSDGNITQEQHDQAVSEQITVLDASQSSSVDISGYMQSYALNCAIKELMQQDGFTLQYAFASDAERSTYDSLYATAYEEAKDKLTTGGYRVYTTLNQEKEDMLQETIDNALDGYTDKSSEGVYDMQGAATCIDNDTGKVVAIVGGRSQDDVDTSLNRAYQSYRQPGSAIKPLVVYTPALEKGLTGQTRVDDHYFEGGPSNVVDCYYGTITMKRAVELSLNTVAWQVFDYVGVEYGINKLFDLEFARITDQDHLLSTALGGLTKGTTTVEMAGGFEAIANNGVFRSPTCIEKITDSDGNVIVDNSNPETKQVYTEDAAHRMTDILEGALLRGTGEDLGLSNITCAAKTGTTNDNKDGWFVGYSAYYTTAVWVGCDEAKTVEDLSGNTFPGTIWHNFMSKLHSGLSDAPLNDEFDSSNDPQDQFISSEPQLETEPTNS